MTPVEQYYRTPLGSKVGTRLWQFDFPEHVGILVPDGLYGLERAVISFTREGIIRQPVGEFAKGEHFSSVSYPGPLPWQVVVQRAEWAMTNRPYNFINFNCDYFVSYCHGVKQESKQVNVGVLLAFAGIVGLAIAASR